MRAKKEFSRKVISMFLLIVFVSELVLPTSVLALTSHNTQPEVWGYQPVDATDNVNLVSGKFNYTIPITSIPEYPMAIGYNSGMGMDHEAGMFGFGFSGFSGAIARNVMGLPDDINGQDKSYDYQNSVLWNLGLKASVSYSLTAAAGVNASVEIGYNSYTGMYGAVGVGLGVGIGAKIGSKDKASAAGGIGVSLINDSRNTGMKWGVGAGAGIGASATVSGDKLNSFGSVAGYGVTGVFGKKNSVDHGGSFALGIGKSVFSSAVSNSSTSLSPLAYVIPNHKSFNFSIMVPLPTTPPVSVGVTYYDSRWGKGLITKKAYGFQYLQNYDRESYDNIADMTIEGEDPREYSSPSYMQRDYFSINTMGLSGTMQLYQPSYGTVSRNYSLKRSRSFSVIGGFYTEQFETRPWTKVVKSVTNKGVNILSLLKVKDENGEAKSFDQRFFSEVEIASLNGKNMKFTDEAVFKMRGDYAGEFNLASSAHDDHQPFGVDLVSIEDKDKSPTKSSFLSFERQIPLYSPSLKQDKTTAKLAPGNHRPIERSTHISKKTVGQVIDEYEKVQGTAYPNLNDDNSEIAFRLGQSYLTHYKCTVNYNNTDKNQMKELSSSSNIQKINIIKELKDLNAVYKMNDAIASVEVQNPGGLRYYFGLPAFIKEAKNLQLQGKGNLPPEKEETFVNGGLENTYNSWLTKLGETIVDRHNRNKVTTTDKYAYPYAWMLTAIVGDDYIDFDNIPGPSDGDIGYWVKFRYVKACDNYRFRTPFNGLTHLPGALHSNNDDMYALSSGTKDIFYLSEIESANYICKYTMQKRFDAVEAGGIVNGEAVNSQENNDPWQLSQTTDYTGKHFQYAVTQIDLYKKHNSGTNSATRTSGDDKIIKSTKFYYDYSICPKVPNNYASLSSVQIPASLVSYHEPQSGNIGTGKLTLQKVEHIAYDENQAPTPLPSYQFEYWGEGESNSPYNPKYDNQMFDQWGNYMANARQQGWADDKYINYYKHYTEIRKSDADENARVYNLKQIKLPSGGVMDIDYEAQSYSKVADKSPFVMRNVLFESVNFENDALKLKVDVSDLVQEGVSLEDSKILSPNPSNPDPVPGELAFYQINNTNLTGNNLSASKLFIATDSARVTEIDNAPPVLIAGRYYKTVTFKSHRDPSRVPFVDHCRDYMYGESQYMRMVKELAAAACIASNGTSAPLFKEMEERYSSMKKDGLLTMGRKMAANSINMFTPDESYQGSFDACFGVPAENIFSHLSFIRTPVYKAKYTGSRVKSITLTDNFVYGTEGSNDIDTENNTYGTRYYYDQKSDGTGASAGVATIEPGGGYSSVIDVYTLKGVGFAPSPVILSSKTSLETSYQEEAQNHINGDRISRKKGKTVYEFYTPADNGLQYENQLRTTDVDHGPGQVKGHFFLLGVFLFAKFKVPVKITFNIPIGFLPLVMDWTRRDTYHTKSYSYVDNTDMYGRSKSIIQLDADNQVIGKQQFTYFGQDEAVTMHKNSFEVSDVKKPGMMDQAWSEAYYTKRTKVRNPLPLVMFGRTDRDFSITNVKYTYMPPLLKEVSSTVDGLETKTINTGFDYYTGTPLDVRSKDSYGNEKIVRTVPAYWKYPEMGPRDEDDSYINNLTSSAGTYMYLNQVDDQHVLGAGIVEWAPSTANKWKIINYLRPEREFVSSTQYKYVYTEESGAALQGAYIKGKRDNDKYIKRNAFLFKTYKGYTYEVDLNSRNGDLNGDRSKEGAFKTFTDFVHPTQVNSNPYNVPGWKQLSTNELYAANGVLVQSKDILAKYASQMLGYNFSNTIGATSNASWGASVHDGAENTYQEKGSAPGTKPMLEANRVKLLEAEVVEACNSIYNNRTLNLSEFPEKTPPPSNGIRTGHVITLTVPSVPEINVPFARLNVVFSCDDKVARSLFVSVRENGSYQVLSNLGEDFTGFFTIKQSATKALLVFKASDFESFNLETAFTKTGYTATYGTDIPPCTMMNKSYKVPCKDCAAEVHTGRYAFRLKGGNAKGNEYTLDKNTVTTGEFKRKYKAMVWVHAGSPDEVELVASITRNGQTSEVSSATNKKSTPYVKAGNWILLRVEFDLSNDNPLNNDKANIFIRNSSPSGFAVYDDLRILPFHADMSNWVFEHKFNRVVSGLDNDNFASFSVYDDRGRVKESAVELKEEGKSTVQKFLYNDQKKN